MYGRTTRIEPLPLEVQAQIRSPIAITSFDDVVLELIKNALDADATTIDIQIDLLRGYCDVSDNGVGISAEEFEQDGHLGQMHCTSKQHGSSQFYGKYGRFLSCLSALSLLTILSHRSQNQQESNITFHRSRVISREPNVPLQDYILAGTGTRIIVRDLFGNMPVRLKHRATQFEQERICVKEFDNLKTRVVAILLAYSTPVNVNICDLHSKQRYSHRPITLERGSVEGPRQRSRFSRNHVCGIFSRAGYISPRDQEYWKMASAETALVQIRAAISLKPAPNRDHQFMSLGQCPLDQMRNNILFHEINRLFELSAFGCVEKEVVTSDVERLGRGGVQSARTNNTDLRKRCISSKGIDKWPMFYVRIDTKYNMVSAHQLEEGRDLLPSILDLLRTLVEDFLYAYSFQMKSRNSRRGCRLALKRSTSEPAADSSVTFPSHSQNRPTSPTSLVSDVRPSSGAASRPGAPSGPFTECSRVKSTNLSVVSDLLGEQPRNKGKMMLNGYSPLGEAEVALGDISKIDIGRQALQELRQPSGIEADSELLLDNFDDNLSDDSERFQATNGTEHDQSHMADQQTSDRIQIEASDGHHIMSWVDPRTGRKIRLDPWTGSILHNRQQLEVDGIVHPPEPPQCRPTTGAAPIPNLRAKKTLQSRVNRLLNSSESLVFRSKEEPISTMSCGLDQKDAHPRLSTFFVDEKPAIDRRISRSDLARALVLGQIDHKFILGRVQTADADETSGYSTFVVLIDQHAADERVKVEHLYTELCAAEAVSLVKPIIFEVSSKEAAMFLQRKPLFRRWNILYEIKIRETTDSVGTGSYNTRERWEPDLDNNQHVTIMALPSLIVERCRLEPKIIIDLLRKDVWSGGATKSVVDDPPDQLSPECHEISWTLTLGQCPQGLLEMVNSRACRSAIMFNDVLSLDECEALVRRLATCVFPFQCAHGRPSMVVLGKLDDVVGSARGGWCTGLDQGRDRDFGEAWSHWQKPVKD